MEMVKKEPKLQKIRKVSLFKIILYSLMAIFALITLYPFWYVLIGSFNEGVDYMNGGIWIWPREVTLYNYIVALDDERLLIGFKNTALRTVFNTFISLSFTSLVAYAMSNKNLKLKGFFYKANLFTMFFGGGLIPTFMIIVKLGFYNSFLVYIIPSMYSVYNMIVLSSFFREIPEELRESAFLDGAGEWTIFTKIYLPLSKPVLATVGLWLIVGNWNSYQATLIYTSDSGLMTLQYYLMLLIKQSSSVEIDDPLLLEKVNSTTLTYASIVIATIPVLIVYPFLSKYFSKGIMLGAVKG
ncbi:MAG: carbohydrate ABC transporter permease [Clostridia bacterium]|nr:carbohydrate ABC transporter permease [Clostridia bacterium]